MSAAYFGIGVMTGTSLDGVDIAYCSFTLNENKWTYEILKAETISFPSELKNEIITSKNSSGEFLIQMDRRFAHFIGKSIREFCERYKLKPQFAVSHGQTIFHQPANGFSFQLGDGETIVSHVDFPLVTNLRSKDIALGGQGAPLVPFGEVHLFPDTGLFLNLGGIANLGFGKSGFDICICNLALNEIAKWNDPSKDFDEDGKLAASGKLNEELLTKLGSNEYFSLPAPKSLGEEWFLSHHLPLLEEWKNNFSIADIARTNTEHIALEIRNALRRSNTANETMLITGGGAKNKFLMERIRERSKEAAVEIDENIDELLIEFKEAMIFAFLGLMVLLGKTNTFSSVTGAGMDVCGGSIHLPADGRNKSIL